MPASFLLRFQESYGEAESHGADTMTVSKAKGEGTDHDRSGTGGRALPLTAHGTLTRVKGEQPDRIDSGGVLPGTARTPAERANNTLTYTYVDAEAPRNDDHRRRLALVFPPCS